MAVTEQSVSEREERLNAVLADYLDAERPDDRAALLARHPDLAADIEAFFAGQDGMAELASPVRVMIRPHPMELATGVLGDFRIVREVGRGGMGIVYEAEQISLGRRVALKVLPFAATMDPKQLQRFHNEAKAAASLHHEHVVPVYGVGCERGVHYYAMQFIDGTTLAHVIAEIKQAEELNHRGTEDTEKKEITGPKSSLCSLCLCGNKSAFFRGIAETIAQAAEALEYAHSMGILHRDVKPGNLMVDAGGKLWVADFGLARFGPDAGLTMTGDLLGTLRYMAPEQALAKHGLVDHRVDVYGLGCTLYELLTGRPAIDGEDRQEILRRIAFDEPTSPRKIDKAIPAELETITLTCLAKEPGERYEAARAIADDLRRWLEDKPIQARRSSPMQNARRWARRHRAVVWATGVSAALLLVTALIALAVSNKYISDERDVKIKALEEARANLETADKRLAQIEKANMILASIFRNLDPTQAGRDGKQLRILLAAQLERAAAQLEGEAVGDPLAVAKLQVTLGRSLYNLGFYEKAIELNKAARATFAAQPDADSHDFVTCLNNLAMCYKSIERTDLGLPLYQQALKLEIAAHGPNHRDTISVMNNLATAYLFAGKLDLAIPLLREALERMKSNFAPDDPNIFTCMSNLGLGYVSVGKPELAIPLCAEALEPLKSKLGPDNPITLHCMQNLASAYESAGKFDRAVPLYDEAFRRKKATLGPDHPDTLQTMGSLAEAYRSARKFNLALPLLKEAFDRTKSIRGPDHSNTLACMNNLALGYHATGQLDQALPLFEEALTGMRIKFGPAHPNTVGCMSNLVDAYFAVKEPGKALPLLKEFLEVQHKRLGDSPQLAGKLAVAAQQLLKAGQAAAAEPILRECVAIREKQEPNAWTTFNTRSMLGSALLGQKKYTDAEPLLLAGYEGMKQGEAAIPPAAKVRLTEALQRLVQLYEATDQKDKAAEWRTKLDAQRDATKPRP